MVGIKSCGDGLVKIFSVCLEVFHTKIFGGEIKLAFVSDVVKSLKRISCEIRTKCPILKFPHFLLVYCG